MALAAEHLKVVVEFRRAAHGCIGNATAGSRLCGVIRRSNIIRALAGGAPPRDAWRPARPWRSEIAHNAARLFLAPG
jgi:hypothetical protein